MNKIDLSVFKTKQKPSIKQVLSQIKSLKITIKDLKIKIKNLNLDQDLTNKLFFVLKKMKNQENLKEDFTKILSFINIIESKKDNIEKFSLKKTIENENQQIYELFFEFLGNKNYNLDTYFSLFLNLPIYTKEILNSLIVIDNLDYDKNNLISNVIFNTDRYMGSQYIEVMLDFLINLMSNFSNKELSNFFNLNSKNNFWNILFNMQMEKEEDPSLSYKSLINLIKNQNYNNKKHYQLILNIVEIQKKNKSEAFDSLNNVLKNSNYSDSSYYDLVFNITRRAGFYSIDSSLNCFCKLLEKLDLKKQILVNNIILNNEGYAVYSSLNCFLKIIENPKYDEKDHYDILLHITKFKKPNSEFMFFLFNSFLNILSNENFSKEDLIYCFNCNLENNFFIIFEKLNENTEGNTSNSCGIFMNFLENLNCNNPDYYEFVLNITENIKFNLYQSLNSFLNFLKTLDYNKKDHYHIILNISKNAGSDMEVVLKYFMDFFKNKKEFFKEYYRLILNITKEQKHEDMSLAIESLFNLINSSKYDKKTHYPLILKIKGDLQRTFNSLNNLINNKEYSNQKYYDLILKIINDPTYNVTLFLEVFNNILKMKNYDYKEHYNIILKIIENAKENTHQALNSFLTVLKNENFSNEELIDFFNEKNYWTIFFNIANTKNININETISSFNRILNHKKYLHTTHFNILLQITKNAKQDITPSFKWFLNFLDESFYNEKDHYNVILNIVKNANEKTSDALNLFMSFIKDNPKYIHKIHHFLLLKITENTKENMYLAINSLNEINNAVSISNYYELILNIILNAKENSNFALDSFFNSLSNKHFLNENEYYFSNNYWVIFKNIILNAKENTQDALNSFSNLIKNSNYDFKIYESFVLKIISNAKENTQDALNSFSILLDNPLFFDKTYFKKNSFLLLKIVENAKQYTSFAFDSFDIVISNRRYSNQELMDFNYWNVFKNIEKNAKQHIKFAFESFNNVLSNKSFSNQEIIDFFNFNYWIIFNAMMENNKENMSLLFDSFNKIIKNKKYLHKIHYPLLLNMVKNLKNKNLNSAFLRFNKFLNLPINFKTKHKEKVLELFLNKSPENLARFIDFLSFLYENIYKTEKSQEFLDKMLFLDFNLALPTSFYASFFKKNVEMEKLNKIMLKIQNKEDLSFFHPLAILKIYELLYFLKKEDEIVNLIIENISLFKKIDNAFAFQNFNIMDNKEKVIFSNLYELTK